MAFVVLYLPGCCVSLSVRTGVQYEMAQAMGRHRIGRPLSLAVLSPWPYPWPRPVARRPNNLSVRVSIRHKSAIFDGLTHVLGSETGRARWRVARQPEVTESRGIYSRCLWETTESLSRVPSIPPWEPRAAKKTAKTQRNSLH